jgi:hypothetical protein
LLEPFVVVRLAINLTVIDGANDSTSLEARGYTARVSWPGKFSKALAVALILWCAGTGCMVVSYARGAMSETDLTASSVEPPMPHMSASMDAHACCKAKHRALKSHDPAKLSTQVEFTQLATSLPTPTGAMSCCPLTSGSIVVASRSQTNDNATELTQPGSCSLKLISSNQTPVAVPLRLPNRALSYLLDCTFLI